MDELDTPASPEELYRDRGEVAMTVPLMQGDVFRDVGVPGLEGDSLMVQVVTHPCSMRNGATLRERIAVAPVKPLPGGYSGKLWANKHVNRMLLPGLEDDHKAYAAELLDAGPVPASFLTLDRRIATLSNAGVVLLQQRRVYSETRVLVPKQNFEDVLLPIFAELEMQETWVEWSCSMNPPGTEGLDEAIKQFHAWLDADDRLRRRRLSAPTAHAELRRDMTRELRERFGDMV